jgi:RimJ/RimL family protein N-acetyltransferase/predicted SprT family Zn-dependent metalloprotease
LEAGEVSLRQLTEVWVDEVFEMVNDPQVRQLTGTVKPFSKASVLDWLASRRNQTERCDWAILHNASGEFVGEVVLNDYDQSKNSMNLRIALAGERWFDQGIGTSVIDAVLTYAFDGMQLEKLTLSVLVDNPRARRVYQKLGFRDGRQYSEGKLRFQRMSITKLEYIGAMAERLMGESLDTQKWQFAFDAGKRRAGLCDHTNSRISLSRHMSLLHPVDQSRQVMYHEIAHALAGAKHGHDAQWLRIAKDLGYRNEKISAKEVDLAHAKWQGLCPNGHEYFRYKKPTRISSCSKCSRNFDDRYRISWSERV